MTPIPETGAHVSHLANPLATPEQLSSSGSQLDGIPPDLEDSIRFAGARLTQAAGILLRLPQDVVAQAVVTFTRFWVGPEGGSFAEYGAKDVSAASLYLTAKLSAHPRSPRAVLNVYAYLDSLPSTFPYPSAHNASASQPADPESCYLSEGAYQASRALLLRTESHVLRVLGFQTHVALPYVLCINYLQTLDAIGGGGGGGGPDEAGIAKRAFAHLNAALLSPQLLYLTHQPPALAVAAVYLAAREVGVRLPAEEWWEVFDVDREELGFLVVGLRSMEGFALEEKAKWGERKVPMTVAEVRKELEKRNEQE